jgi:hypothetical protein
MGGGAANMQAMFRRMGSTITEAWNQVKIDVTNAADIQIKDTLSVEKSEQALWQARQKHLKVLNETGDLAHQLATPEQERLEKRKESQTDLEEHEEALRVAEKKRRDDQRNAEPAYAKAVKDITEGTKDAAEAGKEANLSVENITKGLVANAPGAEEALKKFNGTLESIQGFGPQVTDILFRLADFLKNSGNAALNSAVQMHLFGRTIGTEMVVPLSEGSRALKEYQQRMVDLGLVITGPMVKAGEEFGNAFNRLSSALSTTTKQIGLMFAPDFTEQMQTFTKYIEENHEAIMKWATDMVGQVKPIIVGFFDALKGLVGAMTGIDVGGGKAEEWKKTWLEIGKVVKTVGDTIASVLNGIKKAIDSLFDTDVSKFTASLVGLAAWKILGASIGGSIMTGLAGVLLGPEGIAAIIAIAAAAAGLEYFLKPKKPEPVKGRAHVATTEELFAKEEEGAKSEFRTKVEVEDASKGSERYEELEKEKDRKLAEVAAERQRVKEEPGYEPTAREHALRNLDAMGLLRTSVDKQTSSTDALTAINKKLEETNKQLIEKGGKEEAKPGVPAGTVTTTTIDQTFREAVTRIGGGAIINVEKSLKEFNESLKSTSAFVSPSSRTDAAKFYENTKVTEDNTKSIDRNTAVMSTAKEYTSPGFEPSSGIHLGWESPENRGFERQSQSQSLEQHYREILQSVTGARDLATGRIAPQSRREIEGELAVERKAIETAAIKPLTEALRVIEKQVGGPATFAERFMPFATPTVPPGALTGREYEEQHRKDLEEEKKLWTHDEITEVKRTEELSSSFTKEFDIWREVVAGLQGEMPTPNLGAPTPVTTGPQLRGREPVEPARSAEVLGARVMDAWADKQAKTLKEFVAEPVKQAITTATTESKAAYGKPYGPEYGRPGGLGAPMVAAPGLTTGITKFAEFVTDLFSRAPSITPAPQGATYQTLARGGVEPTAREVEASRSAAEREALDQLLGVKSDQQRQQEESGVTRVTTSLMEKMDTLVKSVLVTVSGPTGRQEQVSVFQAMLGVLTQILVAIRELGSDKKGGGGGSGGEKVEKAGGGQVRGLGSGTSDNVPAMLSVGEYVVRADGSNLDQAISHFRPYAWGGLIARGDYAKGGEVETALANSTNLNQAWSSYAVGGDVKSTTQSQNTISEQASKQSSISTQNITGGDSNVDTASFAAGGDVKNITSSTNINARQFTAGGAVTGDGATSINAPTTFAEGGEIGGDTTSTTATDSTTASNQTTNVSAGQYFATGGPVSADKTIIQHFAGGGLVRGGDVSTNIANAEARQQPDNKDQHKASDSLPERQGDFSVRHTVTAPNITQEGSQTHLSIGGPISIDSSSTVSDVSSFATGGLVGDASTTIDASRSVIGSGTSDVRDRHGSTRQPSVSIRPDTDSITNIQSRTNINAPHLAVGGIVGGDADTTNINALSRTRYEGSDNSITAHTGGLIDHIVRNYVTGGLVSNLVSNKLAQSFSGGVSSIIQHFASGGPVSNAAGDTVSGIANYFGSIAQTFSSGGPVSSSSDQTINYASDVASAVTEMFNGGVVGGQSFAQTMQPAASGFAQPTLGSGAGSPSGHPVNIVIDGNTFSGFTAPAHAIDQVQNYAVDRRLRGAGSKPSWYR